VNVCAKGAIVLVEDSEGFLYPQIDESSCVDCSACVKACPAIKEIPSFSAQFHMAWHKDDDVLKKSSSGGAFTALAEYVLKRGGVVYGAAKDSETWEVCHVMADNAESLDKLRLSKYYQSNTKRVYQEIRAFLEEGRFVLFSGTACQVAGLCSALEHWHVDSDVMRGSGPKRRLITVDVLCHGVTSKKVVMSYIRAKEKRYKKKISDFQFRVKTKDVGWIQGGGTRMLLEFSDGTNKVEDKSRDTFFVGFNKYLFLRESCYRCKYCGTERVSDFTIADFWGINPERITPKQMRLGVSIVCANTDFAKGMLPELSESLHIESIDPNDAIPHNLAFTRPGARPKVRDTIFGKLEIHDFDSVIKHICWKHYLKMDVKDAIIKCVGEKRYHKMVGFAKRLLRRK